MYIGRIRGVATILEKGGQKCKVIVCEARQIFGLEATPTD